MKRGAILLLIILSGWATPLRSQLISTDKTQYRSAENAVITLFPVNYPCEKPARAVYVDLLNARQHLIQRHLIRLSGDSTRFLMPFSGMDTGYYVLHAWGMDDPAVQGTAQAIGIDIPPSLQQEIITPRLFLFPESGRALLNFSNRFLFRLQQQNGLPYSGKIQVRNKNHQLVAAGATNADGWLALDIPVLKEEQLTIQTAGGIVLRTINTMQDSLISNTGFSIHAEVQDGKIIAETQKAEGEPTRKVQLQLVYEGTVLYQSACVFQGDTAIISTEFPVEKSENRLLQLICKGENGATLASRLIMPASIQSENQAAAIRGELLCKARQNGPLRLNSFLPALINDQLISMEPVKSTSARGDEFSLYFLNPRISERSLNYSIVDSAGNILQMGAASADSEGKLEISGCAFRGNARVKFFGEPALTKDFKPIAAASGISADYLRSLLEELSGTQQPDDKQTMQEQIAEPLAATPGKTLDTITVFGKRKLRLEELDRKYVSSGIFKELNAMGINVEDDRNARYYSLLDYLSKEIPGLMVRKEPPTPGAPPQDVVIYRMGYVDFYINELTVGNDIPNIQMSDIGYIKFFRSPVRGGFGANRGGALLRGSSFTGGLQGSIVIYTLRRDDITRESGGSVPVKGFENQP